MENFRHGKAVFVAWDDARLHAAAYPQVIALTRLIASPYWYSQAFQNLPHPHRFLDEVRRTVAADYRWWFLYRHNRRNDPLVEWISAELTQAGEPNLLEHQIAERYIEGGFPIDIAFQNDDDAFEPAAGIYPNPPEHRHRILKAIRMKVQQDSRKIPAPDTPADL